MKHLTERTEIASAINFKRYPVIAIDISQTDEYGIAGSPVCIDNGTFNDGNPYFIDATLRAYKDDGLLTFVGRGSCIKSSFGYSDMEKMLKYANAPVVKPGQEILVCVIDSHNRLARPPVLLKTGDNVSPFCITPLTLEAYPVLTPERSAE